MMPRATAAAVAAATAAALAGVAGATQMPLTLLDTARYPLAVCGDGTPAGYYWRASPTKSNTWVLFQEGGGWGWDAASVNSRSGGLVSSKPWAVAADFQGLLNSSDAAPTLRDANLVFAPYCSSDGWIGDATMPPSAGYDYPHVRGRRIVDAILADLVTAHGMGSAGTPDDPLRFLYTGCSAGARGALFNLHRVAAAVRALPVPTSFGALLDSAFWLDLDPINATIQPFMDQVRDVYASFNVTGGLDPACLAAFPGADGWKCLLGQYAVGAIDPSIPYLLHAFQYDAYQLPHDLGTGQPPATPAQFVYAELFRNLTRAAAGVDTVAPARAHTGAHLPSCWKHCNTQSSEWSTLATQGVTLEAATERWFTGLTNASYVPTFLVEDCQGFNCGTDCPAP
jgi:O-palmitoleoyl-L-serine hydrolase